MIPDATKRMEAALKRHVAAIMAGDADSVMRNFADDAAAYTSEDPLHGQDAIRAGIESFINNTPEGKGTISRSCAATSAATSHTSPGR